MALSRGQYNTEIPDNKNPKRYTNASTALA